MSSLPRCAATIALVIANPSPMPGTDVLVAVEARKNRVVS
jgi:hypothetical protein